MSCLLYPCYFSFHCLHVPYTLSLVSIQWLQRFSHFRHLSWVHRLMPLFDAYTGPYKHKHRYWTGLLLLIQVLALVIFTTNNPTTNPLIISVILFLILIYFCYMRVYKSSLNNVLESLSLLNMVFIASSYQLLNNHSGIILFTTITSVSIAFIMFVFIVFYHASLKIVSLRRCKHMRSRIVTAVAKMKRDEG